jgi:ribulose-5-phosphate 4-epimerase/fuculose-1-phosphate aldolase
MDDLERKLRDEIARVGADLYQRRYTVGSSGNISARLPDGWLITPTDACLGHLHPDSIAKVNAAGEWVGGDKPSKTLTLHRGIYEQNPAVNGVVHTHSTHLVALTLAGVWRDDEILPPITPYQVMKVGRVPLIKYCRPGDAAVAAEVRPLATIVRAVMLERLGPVAWGASVEQAAWSIEELEETAQLWLLSNPKPQPLSTASLDELIQAFNVRWY